jgi:nucleoside-diphosphate-sugar epimerase
MRVLVTGGGGKVGQWVIGELQQHGHTVTVFDQIPLSRPDVRALVGQLTLWDDVRAAVEGQDAIIHLAAVPDPTPTNAADIAETNIKGTFHMYEAAAQLGVGRVAVASSICAYGVLYWKEPRPPDFVPLDESHPSVPDDAYGVSKLVNEQMGRGYHLRYGTQVVCLRLSPVCFPNVDGFVKRYLDRVRKPELHADRYWAYVLAADVAQAFRLAVERSDLGFQVLNIGADDVLSEETTLALLQRFYPGTRAIRDATLYFEHPHAAVIDNRRARSVLGWAPHGCWRQLAAAPA